jgi:hypothetical protein
MVHQPQGSVHHVFVEKKDRGEGLRVRGRGQFEVDGKVSEEGQYLLLAISRGWRSLWKRTKRRTQAR